MEDFRSVIKKMSMSEFFPAIVHMKSDGWRLSQICATCIPGGYEMSYSFCRDYDMVTLRIEPGENEEVASITQIYPCAFIQESEAAELFGVKICNIKPDYRNGIYRIDEETPFRDKE